MITDLHQEGKQWFWKNAYDSWGVYYTNKSGKGVFFKSWRTGETRQILGTCQFSACETASGMRRKLNKMFSEFTEDPRM